MLTVKRREAREKNEGSFATRKPTEFLLRNDINLLSHVKIYELTAEGFAFQDVKDMLAGSALMNDRKIISRIVGRSVRTLQRQEGKKQANLNPQQSAVALQYAKILEDAVNVFGTQQLAEEWLGRPCKFLEGNVPLDMIDNPVGFQAVEEYLERIEYGVYQ